MKYLQIIRDALGALLASNLASYGFDWLVKSHSEQSALAVYHLFLWTFVNVTVLILAFLLINIFQPSVNRSSHSSWVALLVGSAIAAHAVVAMANESSIWRTLFIAVITFMLTFLSAAAGCGLSFAFRKKIDPSEPQSAQGTN